MVEFAEDVNYWKTGKSGPDTWVDKAKAQIVKIGGGVLAEGYGADDKGRAAYMLGFELDGEKFKIIWPVLTPKGGDVRSARRQAATMLYHHVKAACMSSLVLGSRAAFFAHLIVAGRKGGRAGGESRVRPSCSEDADRR